MVGELERFVLFLRGAFSRRATYVWFVIVFTGFLARDDTFGVTSIVRALSLAPESYTALLHFFHSSAWSVEGLMGLWWEWLVAADVAYRVGDRLVLVGDHTKTPKDGRKMPAVTALHQDSETGSKPAFFRGHHWGCIGMLVCSAGKFFATPLWATIQEGVAAIDAGEHLPKTIRIVRMAQRVANAMGRGAYLVLDAYFAVGPVFQAAAQQRRDGDYLVHILTRAKKNVVAYRPAPAPRRPKRGPRKKYGTKLHLLRLFDSKAKAYTFQTAEATLYGRPETVRYLTLDLLWRPIKGMLRFILIESSCGRLVLMTSDLNLDPLTAVQLYGGRVTIETVFDTLKNTLGALGYHFWSRHLRPASRRPRKNSAQDQSSSNLPRTRNTLAAIEKFVAVEVLVLGMLQLIARKFPEQVKDKARCWLRTTTSAMPSAFVTRNALANVIKNNSCGLAEDLITQLIRQKQKSPTENALGKDAP
ncbi:MAG: transposase [Planctomycetota bacterium]|jgi:hypothetical protein